MALLHRATLVPTKGELVDRWLAAQPWAAAAEAPSSPLGAYRFDDPGGEVGIETLLVTTGGARLQVPVTYRGAPLDGAEAALIGTMEHSVLGRRWVYDGAGDPVYVAAVAAAIAAGGREAELDVRAEDGSVERREPTTRVRGSGTGPAPSPPGVVTSSSDATTTSVAGDGLVVVIRRVLDSPFPDAGDAVLTGTWPGQDEPVVLVRLARAA